MAHTPEKLNGLIQAMPENPGEQPRWQALLREELEYLIANDFNALLNLLYRVDVPEWKVREALRCNPDKDTAEIMARLLVARHLEKKQSRDKYKSPDGPVNDEEKW